MREPRGKWIACSIGVPFGKARVSGPEEVVFKGSCLIKRASVAGGRLFLFLIRPEFLCRSSAC